jgi:translation initiation factor 1
MNRKSNNRSGIVYSTDPSFQSDQTTSPTETTLPATDQLLKIRLETKHRAGKAVTLIEGFIGSQQDKDVLVKQLKNYCGTGGSSKDGEMLIQGDQREKVMLWLQKNGYIKTKKV